MLNAFIDELEKNAKPRLVERVLGGAKEFTGNVTGSKYRKAAKSIKLHGLEGSPGAKRLLDNLKSDRRTARAIAAYGLGLAGTVGGGVALATIGKKKAAKYKRQIGTDGADG